METSVINLQCVHYLYLYLEILEALSTPSPTSIMPPVATTETNSIVRNIVNDTANTTLSSTALTTTVAATVRQQLTVSTTVHHTSTVSSAVTSATTSVNSTTQSSQGVLICEHVCMYIMYVTNTYVAIACSVTYFLPKVGGNYIRTYIQRQYNYAKFNDYNYIYDMFIYHRVGCF